jgi:hypothetical protein
MTDKIADSLGVEPKLFERPKKMTSLVPAAPSDFTAMVVANKKEDYVAARDNIRNLIAEVEMVVSDAVDEVRSNPSARMYETFALLVKTYADLNKDLIAVSGPQKEGELSQPNEPNARSPVNNVVFVGTSDALIDQIRTHMSK